MPTAGWLWYAHDGKAYHGGDGRKFGARGARARRGDRVGVRLRGGALSLHLNGELLGVAFEGLQGAECEPWI